MKKWLTGALCAALACGLGGSFVAKAQITSVGGAYLFRRKLQKGMTFNYSMTAAVQAKGMPKTPQGMDLSNQKMSTTMKMTVLDIKDKKATVQVETSALTMNDKQMSEGRRTEVEMTERGQKGATGGQRGMGGSQPGEEIEYPEKPLKVGDVVPIKLGQLGASNIRFVGFKPYKGKDAALWQMPFNSAAKGGKQGAKGAFTQKISGVINILISKEDGWPLSTTVTMDMSMQMGDSPITAKTTSTIVRQ